MKWEIANFFFSIDQKGNCALHGNGWLWRLTSRSMRTSLYMRTSVREKMLSWVSQSIDFCSCRQTRKEGVVGDGRGYRCYRENDCVRVCASPNQVPKEGGDASQSGGGIQRFFVILFISLRVSLNSTPLQMKSVAITRLKRRGSLKKIPSSIPLDRYERCTRVLFILFK